MRRLPDGVEMPYDAVETPASASLSNAHPMTAAPIVVLAAVVEDAGRFLVTRRLAGTHLAGLWEFPGGKCSDGETHGACLERELLEELGVAADIGAEIIVTQHVYADRTVRLHFRRCSLKGRPSPQLGQEMKWVTRAELGAMDFPDADLELIRILTSPPQDPQ